jgi:hypothetical protein
LPEFEPVSLLVTPSYEKLNDVWPLIDMPPTEPHPGASRADVSMTPGSTLRLPMKSRPFRPMSSIWLAVMVAERSPLVVWTLTDSAATDTTSVSPPISSAIARSARRSAASRTMPFCS